MPPSENSEVQRNQAYNLPPPVDEAISEVDAENPEYRPSTKESAPSQNSSKASNSKTQITDFQLKDFSVAKPTSAATTTTNDSNPAVADDDDLIEKEWVEKAKRIIEQNREDPKKQSEEMTLFKADYMKKRYNKVIKVSE
ncbi:MAG: hypothetical protein ACYCPS_02405 [Candidatus Saccharimonadales bacterium]